ncbi:MAG: methyl-accepting chemotaxis protein [Thermacetogeniaceae bacterium]
MFEKFRGSLRTMMVVLFGLVVLVGCLVLSFLSEDRAGKVLESESRQAMLKLIKQAAETQDSRVQARLCFVEGMASQDVIRGRVGEREATTEEKLAALRSELESAKSLGFKDFGIADLNGKAVFVNGRTADISDREYFFKKAVQGKPAVSSTIVSRDDNSVVFAYAAPVRHYATGEITGVLFGLVDAASFSKLVSNITYGRTGYAFAVDGEGKTIAHKDTEKVLSQENIPVMAATNRELASLAAVVSKMARGEEGIDSYTYQGVEKLIAYAPVKSVGWSLAVTVPKAEIMQQATTLRHSMLTLSVIIILIALALTYAIANNVATPLVRAVNFLGVIASGDFTGQVSETFLRRKDEVGMLARAVDGLQSSIRPLLASLKEDARVLAESSENLSAASEEIASSSNEVAKAVQEVAKGATEQAGSLQEILNLLGKMTTNLEKVENELSNVKNSAEEASRQANLGKKELDLLVASINTVHDAFKVVAEKLNRLSGSVSQVGEILEVINDIADQTNLLALNAAIEAARAGDAGRGFAVVAEEVRKLAEQSRASSEKIKELLVTIMSGTNEVVSTSEEVDREVVAQLENVEKTVKAFDDILDSVISITPAIEETYRHLDNTIKAKDVVLDRAQSISAVAEETSASAEEISASTEEFSASTEEIAASAQELMNISKQLMEQVERFKV